MAVKPNHLTKIFFIVQLLDAFIKSFKLCPIIRLVVIRQLFVHRHRVTILVTALTTPDCRLLIKMVQSGE